MSLEDKYKKWVRAAFIYYIRPGDDTGMTDHEWDAIAKELAAAKPTLPPESFPLIHHPDWFGGSLFFVRMSEYPSWAKEP